jgi:hypothetical protein
MPAASWKGFLHFFMVSSFDLSLAGGWLTASI